MFLIFKSSVCNLPTINVVGRLMIGGRLFSLFIFEACIGVDVSYFQVKCV